MDRRRTILFALVALLIAVLWFAPWPTPAPPAPGPASQGVPAPVVVAPPSVPEPPGVVAERPPPEPSRPTPTVKARAQGWEDDRVYLEELLGLAVRAVDAETPEEDLDIACTSDNSRCRVRAPLLDPDIDEDGLWDVAREAVTDAVGATADAALTRVRIFEPDDDLPLMEIEVTLVVD